MLALEQYGDVTRLRFSTAVSRALGYEVSAYFTRGVLVDSGFPAVGGDLAAWLEITRPVGAIVTHHHEDHAGNVELIAARGIPIAASDDTLDAARRVRRLDMYRRICWGQPAPLRSPVAAFAPEGLRLLASPGHCRDHHVVWDAERKTLFSADLFLGVKLRVAQASENAHQLAQSLRAAIALAPARMFCAHRGLVNDPVGALRAKADWLDELIGSAARLRSQGLSDAAIARRLLGREGVTNAISLGKLSKTNLIRSVPR
jgi:endoribonuclease LACTB2